MLPLLTGLRSFKHAFLLQIPSLAFTRLNKLSSPRRLLALLPPAHLFHSTCIFQPLPVHHKQPAARPKRPVPPAHSSLSPVRLVHPSIWQNVVTFFLLELIQVLANIVEDGLHRDLLSHNDVDRSGYVFTDLQELIDFVQQSCPVAARGVPPSRSPRSPFRSSRTQAISVWEVPRCEVEHLIKTNPQDGIVCALAHFKARHKE